MESTDATLSATVQPTIDPRALTPPTAQAQRVANLWVIATVAVALLLGWGLMAVVTGRTASYQDAHVAFHYPATWVVDQDDLGNPMVRNPQSATKLFNDRVLVIQGEMPRGGLPGGSPLNQAATAWTLNRSKVLSTFRNLTSQDGLTVAGQPAIRVDYAYVADPASALGRPGIPVVVRGSDYLLAVGEKLLVISGQGDAQHWDAFQPQLQRIIDSVTTPEEGS